MIKQCKFFPFLSPSCFIFKSKSQFHTSWWFQPIWKIWSSNWIISPSRGEHRKSLKPPSFTDSFPYFGFSRIFIVHPGNQPPPKSYLPQPPTGCIGPRLPSVTTLFEGKKWGKSLDRRNKPRRKNIWLFPKIGVPQNGWFIIENPIKMDYLGVPLTPCQMMIGVYNHLLSRVFRFHYHSQKVIGSLGNYTTPWKLTWQAGKSQFSIGNTSSFMVDVPLSCWFSGE